MTFKEFMRLSEAGAAGGGGDNGLMGFPVPSSVRKPSDGQPFKNLGPVAGQTPRPGGGGGGGPMAGGPQMMKKKMRKK